MSNNYDIMLMKHKILGSTFINNIISSKLKDIGYYKNNSIFC